MSKNLGEYFHLPILLFLFVDSLLQRLSVNILNGILFLFIIIIIVLLFLSTNLELFLVFCCFGDQT